MQNNNTCERPLKHIQFAKHGLVPRENKEEQSSYFNKAPFFDNLVQMHSRVFTIKYIQFLKIRKEMIK